MTFLNELEPEIFNERCTHYRYRYSQCQRCSEQCPHDAILIDEDGVSLKSGACTGCALCASICPSSVFRPKNLPLAKIAKPESKQLSIACRPSGVDADFILPCLGSIHLSILASLALREVSINLKGSHHCDDCYHAPKGNFRLQLLLDSLDSINLSNESGQSFMPVIDNDLVTSGMTKAQAERRQFFNRVVNKTTAAISDSALDSHEFKDQVPLTAIRSATHFIPVQRRLSEKLLNHISKSITNKNDALSWSVAYVDIGENNCSGCDACARVCPTGALKVSEDAQWTLLFSAEKCVGCDVCQEVCMTNSIRVTHGWRVSDTPTIALHVLHRHRCQECGRFFVGTSNNQCPVCVDDEDSFTAIFG